MKYYPLILLMLISVSCTDQKLPDSYEGQLNVLQQQYESFCTDAPRFFLFGMGNRDKYVYKDYQLISIDNDSVIFHADSVLQDSIMPDKYMVQIETTGGTIRIEEDEIGIWISQGKNRCRIPGKECTLKLPTFQEHKYGKVLRVLHHELLFNVQNSRIYPNILVYREPFYRDAFMAALCLEKTENTNLLSHWLYEEENVYDMQNGEAEADNIGEMLYMLSFISTDSNSILRKRLKEEIQAQTIKEDDYQYIKGHTDGAENAAYQTQILKYALQKNGMPDSFTEPPAQSAGAYFDLCWFTQGSSHNRDLLQRYKDFRFNYKDSPFPYLHWARAHYYSNFKAPFNQQQYPLSWEKRGGSAHFEGMHVISDKAVGERICYPHAWTAAEMFLKLYDEQ